MALGSKKRLLQGEKVFNPLGKKIKKNENSFSRAKKKKGVKRRLKDNASTAPKPKKKKKNVQRKSKKGKKKSKKKLKSKKTKKSFKINIEETVVSKITENQNVIPVNCNQKNISVYNENYSIDSKNNVSFPNPYVLEEEKNIENQEIKELAIENLQKESDDEMNPYWDEIEINDNEEKRNVQSVDDKEMDPYFLTSMGEDSIGSPTGFASSEWYVNTEVIINQDLSPQSPNPYGNDDGKEEEEKKEEESNDMDDPYGGAMTIDHQLTEILEEGSDYLEDILESPNPYGNDDGEEKEEEDSNDVDDPYGAMTTMDHQSTEILEEGSDYLEVLESPNLYANDDVEKKVEEESNDVDDPYGAITIDHQSTEIMEEGSDDYLELDSSINYEEEENDLYNNEHKKKSRNPDWDCKCGAMGCFGSKSTCYKCGALNPNGGGSPRKPDWDCACGTTGCFGSKPFCWKCGEPNPNGDESYGGQKSGGRQAKWIIQKTGNGSMELVDEDNATNKVETKKEDDIITGQQINEEAESGYSSDFNPYDSGNEEMFKFDKNKYIKELTPEPVIPQRSFLVRCGTRKYHRSIRSWTLGEETLFWLLLARHGLNFVAMEPYFPTKTHKTIVNKYKQLDNQVDNNLRYLGRFTDADLDDKISQAVTACATPSTDKPKKPNKRRKKRRVKY